METRFHLPCYGTLSFRHAEGIDQIFPDLVRNQHVVKIIYELFFQIFPIVFVEQRCIVDRTGMVGQLNFVFSGLIGCTTTAASATTVHVVILEVFLQLLKPVDIQKIPNLHKKKLLSQRAFESDSFILVLKNLPDEFQGN